MAKDPELRAHQEWLGYVQPVGLVVSPPALLAAQAHINKNIIPDHARFLQWVQEVSLGDAEDPVLAITDLHGWLQDVFGWEPADLIGSPGAEPVPDSLEVTLPEYNETLRPTYVVKEIEPQNGAGPWLMLIEALEPSNDLDDILAKEEIHWQASPTARFERLLRETKVPIGLLFNGTHLRLVYAPHGETSGYLTFPVQAMSETTGRPIFAALHMLLSADRLFSLPRRQRLAAILDESRKYQNLVSTQLSDQVLSALYELLRGFQAADDHAKGDLLRDALQKNPDDVYAGLLTVLLRLVFILYAEDRGLLSTDSVYTNHYSLTGLFERLRDDDNRYPDTMDQRYGAWAQLLTLFRLIHDGAKHGNLNLPPRRGGLFDPDRYKFLEGRTGRSNNQDDGKFDPPMVSDGVVYRVLNGLLILDGERLSYRTLDVEEIGSVYQTVMGFGLEVARGPSIAIVGKRKHKGQVAAPTVINLEELLTTKPADRVKWLRERTDQEFSGEAEKGLKTGTNVDDLLAVLDRKIARQSTPNVVQRSAMVLQPTDERRRSGSHYTPRSFTEPIVRTTLRPILQRLGEHPTPDQILDLKICDMAVGSAAFLVETCRQLGDELVKAWHYHNERPTIPLDETEELLARRLVAQRCIYGVDRNPMAVDLAKLSLWLATLAKDHPFTFLDHAICPGDSLVGLTRRQIADFHWREEKTRAFGQEIIEKRIQKAAAYRKEILDAGDFLLPEVKRQKLALADTALELVRFAGDCVVAAFFSGDKEKARNEERNLLLERFTRFVTKSDVTAAPNETVEALRSGRFPVRPFHWGIEFPEVFDRENPGFDAIVGNPPFMGGTRVSTAMGGAYRDWLLVQHVESHGNADLVAHFFRRAFTLVQQDGTFGLIATKTIGQGDTRTTGLRWICSHGGTIYAARKRYKWPGQAAVIVSVVWVANGTLPGPFDLDGRAVPIITAYLFHAGGHESPACLKTNAHIGFLGAKVYGQGFIFDDDDPTANPICEMELIVRANPRCAEIVQPYIGGEELLDSPTQAFRRFVINFRDWPLRRADLGQLWSTASQRQQSDWLRKGIVPIDYPAPAASDYPELLSIVDAKVRPERAKLGDNTDAMRRKATWWLWGRYTPGLFAAIKDKERVLGCSNIGNAFAFCFLQSNIVMSQRVVTFALTTFQTFSVMQSRIHEVWARFNGSTLKDDLTYTPSDCFETFPFPRDLDMSVALEQVGKHYYDFRAALMIKNNEGLTKTYNRFHDPEETSPDILKLRELHGVMDRAVLDSYRWTDLKPICEFLLDYEDEEKDDDENSGKKKRKKPWRYRWPDEIRDEVLARLLKLNAERAEEERLSGKATAANDTGKNGKKVKRNAKKESVRGELFD